MFAAGLILIILAIIVVIYVIFATSGLDPMSIDWGVFTADLTPLQLFLLGAVTVLVLAIGSVMLSVGLKTQGEKRAEVKRLRKEVEESKQSRSAEAEDRAVPATEDGPGGHQRPVQGSEHTETEGSAEDDTQRIVRRRPSAETPPRPQSYHTPAEEPTTSDKTPPSTSG